MDVKRQILTVFRFRRKPLLMLGQAMSID